jgi:hypothetical protein
VFCRTWLPRPGRCCAARGDHGCDDQDGPESAVVAVLTRTGAR